MSGSQKRHSRAPTSRGSAARTDSARDAQHDGRAAGCGRSAGGSLRILVVDDNAANTALMRRVLGALGHVPLTAATAGAGLEMAVAERPDLVLLDIVLPGMDGHQVMRLMKATPELAGMPIVALTALKTPGHPSRALAEGFDGYLQKPIDPESVAAVIGEVCGSGGTSGS